MDVLILLFCIPTALGLVAFWSIWRLVRLLNLSLAVRRTLFVSLGTIILAPMLIPVATIMTGWVPHGLLMLMSTELIGYYAQVPQYVFPSFAITAVMFGLVTMGWQHTDTTKPQSKLITFTVPVLVILLMVATFRFFLPGNDIPEHLNHETVEAIYGQSLDEVVALLDMDDSEVRESAVTRLKGLFDSDSGVLRVHLQVNTSAVPDSNPVYDDVFFYQEPGFKSSSGFSRANVTDAQRYLRRLSWSYRQSSLFFRQCATKWFSFVRGCGRRDVLEYSRRFTHQQETLSVQITFDYESMLSAIRSRSLSTAKMR